MCKDIGSPMCLVTRKYTTTKTADDIRLAVADFSEKVHKDQHTIEIGCGSTMNPENVVSPWGSRRMLIAHLPWSLNAPQGEMDRLKGPDICFFLRRPTNLQLESHPEV